MNICNKVEISVQGKHLQCPELGSVEEWTFKGKIWGLEFAPVVVFPGFILGWFAESTSPFMDVIVYVVENYFQSDKAENELPGSSSLLAFFLSLPGVRWIKF